MLGVVLAGGEGRRLGRDKAGVIVDGEPLWMRQVRVLREAGAEPVLLARRRDQDPVEYPLVVHDQFAGSGPLAGLHAALAHGGDPLIAVLAVDMPGIVPGWFAWLLDWCRPGAGAVARHADALEPLAAIYPAGALAMATERLLRGEFSVAGLALALEAEGRMSVVEVPAADLGRMASLNEPPA